jgi:hypothetical protein
MNVKKVTRRLLMRNLVAGPNGGADRSRILILNLSPSRVNEGEADALFLNSLDHFYRYNKKRDLLFLEFSDSKQKLRYMKCLPQSFWTRGCVVWEYSPVQFSQWLDESISS